MRTDQTSMDGRNAAFTLIELLIVVAIIAILAAIAVPNFLEAQVRSKVARSVGDMRIIATAMEAYFTDNNHYPPYTSPENPAGENRWRLNHLSTPIAYITSVPADPFADMYSDAAAWRWHRDAYVYAELEDWGVGRTYLEAKARGCRWFLAGRGPNRILDAHFYIPGGETQYDATNGTVSAGDLERFGP